MTWEQLATLIRTACRSTDESGYYLLTIGDRMVLDQAAGLIESEGSRSIREPERRKVVTELGVFYEDQISFTNATKPLIRGE